MKELSLNVLDIAQNSVVAGAHHIRIGLADSAGRDRLEISVEDDGHGMEAEFLKRVSDPFFTTRTTRKVGMGIPLFKMAAEMSGGAFIMESAPGAGTKVRAEFQRSHIDRPPVGSMPDTIAVLIAGNPAIRLTYRLTTDIGEFVFDTDTIRKELGAELGMDDIPLDMPEVIRWIREYIRESEMELGLQA